jgi:hypothetical protein
MFKKSLLVVICLWLTGCASVYEVAPRFETENGIRLENSPNGLVSTKKHVVTVCPIHYSMSQFESPRFYISVQNRGDFPLEFSTRDIQVRFNNERGRVVSYEAQREAIRNRLAYYGYRVNLGYPLFPYPPFKQNVGFDSTFDGIDIQTALADLNYLERTALRDHILPPHSQYGGEVTLANKLSASDTQFLEMVITVGDEIHTFDFDYHLQQ